MSSQEGQQLEPGTRRWRRIPPPADHYILRGQRKRELFVVLVVSRNRF